MSEKTWPEGTIPTTEQWADWFDTLEGEERLRVAQMVIDNSEAAVRCFIQNHEGAVEEAHYLRRRFWEMTHGGERYRLAWLSARRRASSNYQRALRNVLRGWDEMSGKADSEPSRADLSDFQASGVVRGASEGDERG